jgi:hypothetical protein
MTVAEVARLSHVQHGTKQAMPGSTTSLLDEATRMTREIAINQGLAYRSYGEAMQRFGENKIGWAELFKTAGDIYLKEAAQTVWSLFRADMNIYASMLSLAGAKTLHPAAEPERHDGSSAGRPPQRGRH